MTVQRLTKLYDHLSVWERIPLLVAADARGDDAEYRRLFDASPIRVLHFSEHLLAEQALHILTLIYITEQLDAAATYFLALFQMVKANDPEEKDWILAAASSAHFFTANTEAWRHSADLSIAPQTLTTANHSGLLLPFLEEQMPAHAPPPEELQAQLKKQRGHDVELVTADTLLASWQRLFGSMTNHKPLALSKREP